MKNKSHTAHGDNAVSCNKYLNRLRKNSTTFKYFSIKELCTAKLGLMLKNTSDLTQAFRKRLPNKTFAVIEEIHETETKKKKKKEYQEVLN